MFLPLYGMVTLSSSTSGKPNLPKCDKSHQFFAYLCGSIVLNSYTVDYDATPEHHGLFQVNWKYKNNLTSFCRR